MGTTLTGTTPQDTYDSLIKVTDNGPISSTVKLLSDGLGNDSALALSTARVGIGTTANYSFNDDAKLAVANTSGNSTISIVSGSSSIGYLAFADGTTGTDRYTGSINYLHASDAMTFHTNAGTERMRITSTGNVGIGTSAPYTSLTIGTSDATAEISSGGSNTHLTLKTVGASGALRFFTIGGGTNTLATTETMRITADGYIRMAASTGGIQFNGDTAAANALDDYEEGTWTMGVSFGGASVGVTTLYNSGTYTKVGRQVTVNGLLQLTSKGSSTGAAKITGLPFTVGGVTSYYSASALRFKNIAFVDQYQGMCDPTTTTVILEETTNVGATTTITDVEFANNSEIIISLTYFV